MRDIFAWSNILPIRRHQIGKVSKITSLRGIRSSFEHSLSRFPNVFYVCADYSLELLITPQPPSLLTRHSFLNIIAAISGGCLALLKSPIFHSLALPLFLNLPLIFLEQCHITTRCHHLLGHVRTTHFTVSLHRFYRCLPFVPCCVLWSVLSGGAVGRRVLNLTLAELNVYFYV